MINRSALMPVELQSAQVLGKRQASVAMRYARLSRAFTLTELLVVIAITTILLGLLFVPISTPQNHCRTISRYHFNIIA